jgi:hypothetical protein
MPRQPSPVLLASQARSARRAVPGKHARGRETVGGEGAGGRMQTHTTRRRAVVEAVGSGFPTRKSGTAADAGRPGPKGCRRAQLSWDSDVKKAVFLGLAGASRWDATGRGPEAGGGWPSASAVQAPPCPSAPATGAARAQRAARVGPLGCQDRRLQLGSTGGVAPASARLAP